MLFKELVWVDVIIENSTVKPLLYIRNCATKILRASL